MKDDGYLPDDLLGRAGVEATYESLLRGEYGLQTVQRDAAGRPIQVVRTDRPPVAGSSLRLTIDVQAQRDAEKAMRWGMKQAGMKRGVVIVMNPQNGEILALVSLPSYDNNVFSEGISPAEYQKLLNDPEKPLVNHGISDQYPPGSTYKLVAGTGLLADYKITASTRIRTMGFISLGGFKFRDWNGAGFGLCNIYCGFGHSQRHVLAPGRRDARHRPARLLGQAVWLRCPDGRGPACRGEWRRPDEQVEAGHAGPADLPR